MPTKNGAVRLGDKVRDDVTGVEGIAIGVTTWLNGCRRVVIQPPKEKGKPTASDPTTADEPTVTVIKRRAVKGMNTGNTEEDTEEGLETGGPAPMPKNYPTPRR